MAKPFNGRLKIDENDDGYYAILDSNGSPISDYYYELEYLTDSLAQVYDDDKEKYALLSEDGNLVSQWYSQIEVFKGNYFSAYDDDKDVYALLNSSGKKISDWYSSLDKTKLGFAIVSNSNDEYALLDESGNIVSNWVEDEDDLKSSESAVGSMVNEPISSNDSGRAPEREADSQIATSSAGFKTKVVNELVCSIDSTNPEDYIEVLNVISPALKGVTNLGVFCDIKSVEHSSALLSEVEEQFIHVETKKDEQPYNHLKNDGSSAEPYDYDFDFLLNH